MRLRGKEHWDRVAICFDRTAQARFWGHVQKTGTCWLWTSSVGRAGYPVVTLGRINGLRVYDAAHRLSFYLAHGRAPNALVTHDCDNRRCVNPAHLSLGTYASNNREAWKRGRQPRRAHWHAPVTAYTEPSQWPRRSLTAEETALILGRSHKGVLHACAAGRMDPPPIADRRGDYRKPYRWNRAVLRAYIEQPAVGLRKVS